MSKFIQFYFIWWSYNSRFEVSFIIQFVDDEFVEKCINFIKKLTRVYLNNGILAINEHLHVASYTVWYTRIKYLYEYVSV